MEIRDLDEASRQQCADFLGTSLKQLKNGTKSATMWAGEFRS
jgi:hypothetical protein